MQYQFITVLLVTLFFLLYREHKKGQKRVTDTLRNEIDRLRHKIETLDHSIQGLGDKVQTVHGRPDKPDSQIPSRVNQTIGAR